MTRAQAAERIRKLRALADPARGGSPAERATAKRKADELMARHGLRVRRAARRNYRQPPPVRPQRIFVADWSFNIKSGEHSDNVTVHYHNSPGSWKITVDP